MNLRAALFRVLSDLKKNGDLGKETILRKSMLDDCKGEKFDELLAVFSTAVLHKVLGASIDGKQLNPALRLSLANGITPEDYELALPLVLAYRVSLESTGERRACVMSKYEKFSRLLDNKKVQLEQRSQENPQSVPEEPADFDRLAEQVQTNWLGSEEWANNLLYGGSQSGSDAFLELPFAKVWAKAKESTVEDLKADASRDLLLDLESRVSCQRDRLSRWREYSGAVAKGDGQVNPPSSPSTSAARSNSTVAFKDHQALTVASIAKAVREPESRALPTQQDQSFLFSMEEALMRIDGKPRSSAGETKSQASLEPAEPTASIPPSHDPIPQEPAAAMDSKPEAIPSPDDDGQIDPEPSTDHIIPEITLEEDPEPRLFALAERTRKSMSLVPPRPSLPPQEDQPSRSRHSRMSFPVNPFETPQKKAPPRAQTPRDELFEDSADYASVFKSRPRIAQSPVSSPAVHVSPLGDFDLDADGDADEVDVDMDVNVDQMRGFDSPSIRRR